MPQPPDFADRVYDAVRLIPPGRVTTYGHLAAFAGHRGAARTVGWLLHSQRRSLEDLPAHRVVNREGYLTGQVHFGPGRMAALLAAEGIEVRDNRIKDFAQLLWDPLSLADTGF